MRIECKYDELMPLAEIEKRIHPDNENKHPDEQIRSLAKVIAKIGVRHSIHISKQSGKIAGGHGRLMAFKKLGYDKAPIVWENFNDELEELNYRASDNLGQYAEFSNEDYVKNLEIAGIDIHDVDLEEFGVINFELPEIETLEPQCNEDEVPEVENPITRRGDIWILGNHRLMCGNSTMIDDVEKLMSGRQPDFIHTDPPYGMNAVSKSGVLSSNYKTDILGDDNPDVAKDCFELVQGLYPASKQIWWGANYYSSVLPDSECWIVWDKNNGESDQADAELAWGNFRTVVRMFTKASEKTNRVHPTQKPVQLIEWFLESKRFKIKPELIADFFGGSGSTLIAADKKDIPCYVMEFDPKFSDVIINRWQNYTGKKATLESTGQTYEELKQERENV